MSLSRAATSIGVLAVLASAFFFLVLPAVSEPPTDEEQVRATFAKCVRAVLKEDFETEWDLLSSGAKSYWRGQLAGWKALDPQASIWADLQAVHGIAREDIPRMSVEEFFIACRSGRARLEPEWWASQQQALRSLPAGTFELRDDGTARLTFRIDTDPEVDEVDIASLDVKFEKEDGTWRILQSASLAMTFRTVPWLEPALELPWAEGVETFLGGYTELGLIANLLADGRVIVSEEEISKEELRRRLAAPRDPETQLVFRCDRRVFWSDAAPWLALLADSGAGPVALAVTTSPEMKCRPRREGGEVGFNTAEYQLNLVPPQGKIDPEEIGVVIDIGPVPIDEEGRAALAAADLKPLVLTNPSPDAPWDAVVRVLAALHGAGLEGVLLAAPGDVKLEGGVSVSDHRPVATHPAVGRILVGGD